MQTIRGGRGKLTFDILGDAEPGILGEKEITCQIGKNKFMFRVDEILCEQLNQKMARITLSLYGIHKEAVDHSTIN